MSKWLRVTGSRPCTVCGKSDWCSFSEDGQFAICRRGGTAAGKAKIDKSGADYWVYKLRDEPIRSMNPTITTSTSPLSSAMLHKIYSRLLNALTLTTTHRGELIARGLKTAEIQARGYRSLPVTRRHVVVNRLIELFGMETCARVPGIFRKKTMDGAYHTLAGPEGLLIPCRNLVGEIVALKIRRPNGFEPKYVYMSSSERGGLGPGAPVHVPLHADAASSIIRLTEGELKADIATALEGTMTISVSGVSSWRMALPVLKALNCRTCRLAFDMDAHTNPVVARALNQAAENLLANGLRVEIETWDQKFKGIDECLAAGASVRVQAGLGAERSA